MQEVNSYNYLSCEETCALLSEYADSTLEAEKMVALNAHLETCPSCTRELAAIRETIVRVGRSEAPAHLLAEARVRALRELRTLPMVHEPVHASSTRHPMQFVSRAALPGVALAAAAVGVFIAIRPQPVSRAITPVPTARSIEDKTGLPSSAALDEMANLHTASSTGISPGSDAVQQLAIAEADSRVVDSREEQSE